MAIVNKDLAMLQFLVENGADPKTARVKGLFFRPKKEGGELYFGETPLHFAVSVGEIPILDYLITSCGININQKDSRGNMSLHFAVTRNNFLIYKWLLEHGAKKESRNKDNITPLNYAAKRGNLEMYTQILEIEKDTIWSYGPITCAMYPIDEMNQTLELIVTKQRLKMLKNPVLLKFLKEKWLAYARNRFWLAFLFELLYLFVLMISIGLRPENSEDNNLYHKPTHRAMARYALEILVVFGSVTLLVRNFKSIRKLSFDIWINASGRLPVTLAWLHCVCILLALLMRLLTIQIVEDILVAFACVFAWIHLLSFHRALKLTGSFVVMIYKMLIFDIVRFAAIYMVLLVGFGQAFYVLFRHPGADDQEFLDTSPERPYRSLGWSMLSTFLISFGNLGYDAFDSLTSDYPTRSGFAHLFFIVYIILVTILMLNLLIAMMGSTFAKVLQNAENEWRHQWTRLIVLLENDLNSKERERLRPKNHIKYKDRWWMIIQSRQDEIEAKGDEVEENGGVDYEKASSLLDLLIVAAEDK